MIKAYLYRNSDDKIQSELKLSDIKRYTEEPKPEANESLLWVDIYDTSPAELHSLAEIFNFHPLAIEDCLHHTLRSKVDKYDDYTFFVFNDVKYNEDKEEEIIKITGVLPFNKNEQDVKNIFKDWVKNRFFAPNKFKKGLIIIGN